MTSQKQMPETWGDYAVRILTGQWTPRDARYYIAVTAGVFWGLIALARISYPADHHYSIMSHTFSFLGSFEPKHNPEWWWIFSFAMGFWAISTVPHALFFGRTYALTAPRIGRAVTVFMWIACVGMFGVACFPDAHGAVIGNWEWTDIHEKAAVVGFLGGFAAILTMGGIIIRNLIRGTRLQPPFPKRILIPFGVWLAILILGIHFQVTWARMYPVLKARAQAAGLSFGSSWSESLHTVYGFPLWENLIIYAQFVFLAWSTLILADWLERRNQNR